ncbi:pilus assembly protein PilX [Acinetobacter chinensis]|jgi:hypothetical protein|uniref:Pilus assembly PilX N-terminal domain-containing protein n=1 Tax=Acinetobacter chinensis TaxID=2004650 RepID=A0A3B7M6G6_9GAMM|nr:MULTISPECIES: pilus assembly PilX N-terminal domain-containing protein [Acinetobacter]AXY58019.1 pilus assembly protein PilX [Acinetobacter chinensis]AXY58923.1 pilus assembly protein PilX [Acinetobacter sp. WCHAc010052]MDV2469339.1 pilus assembly PilX N-terminal domain-containing protein [Acinetobacter chinensis]
MKHQNHFQHQRGAALVVVLFILSLILVIGVLAIRQSITSLQLSMNSQVDDLLRQGSDAVMLSLEKPDRLGEFSTSAGLLGFIRRPENQGKELVFCFREGKKVFFDINTASMIYKDGSTIKNSSLGMSGYCDPTSTTDNHFTSNRRAVLTQVAIRRASATDTPFENFGTGTDAVSAKTDSNDRFTVYVTSVLPGLGAASMQQIRGCLTGNMSTVTNPTENTVSKCLEALEVPYSTQVAEYNYVTGFSS